MLTEQERRFADVAGLPQDVVGPMRLTPTAERAASQPLSPGRSHNEVVLDAAHYTEQLPASVEAFFVHASSSAQVKAEVRALHASFVSEHGLTADAAPPLLTYDGLRSPPFAPDDGS